MLRLSQRTEEALMLISPPVRSAVSPQRSRSTARVMHEDIAGSPVMGCMLDEEESRSAPLDRTGNEDLCDVARLSTAVKVHNHPPAVGVCANWTGKKEEDRAFVEGGGRMLAVFDGHLGPALSQFAADAFPAALRKAALDAGATWEGNSVGLARVESAQCAQTILGAAFRICHEEARRLQKRGGTTALVFWSCLVDGRRTGFCANAGKNKQKVLTIVTSYSKYTRALTCENFCPNSGDSRAVLRCAPPSRHRPPFFCPALVALTHCYSAPMGFVCACCHVHVRYHSLNPQP